MPRSPRMSYRLVDLATQKGGTLLLSDPDVIALMGKTLYKMPTQMWAVRTKLGIPVTAIRQGRKVVGYTLTLAPVPVDVNPPTDTASPATIPAVDGQ